MGRRPRIELNGRVTSATLISRLRTDLAAAHFSVPGLTGLWGIEADAALRRNQRVPARRALAALATTLDRNEPAATLARLFLLGDAVPRADLDAALPALGAAGAEQLGLVRAVDGIDRPPAVERAGARGVTAPDALLCPLVDLRPYSFIDAHGAGSWWIVSDLGELALGHPLGETHVLGIGGASRTLSALMMPTPVERALDIGTGCGIQAMHASRHAECVVATDISVRALELAALNAELNDIYNIEFRFGSLFEPVFGERFDHIISNPPFVITPRAEGVPSYEYRDGGMVGDALVEAVVRGAADHLTPGGVVQLLGNWEYHDETDAFERLEHWLTPEAGESATARAALDAWIIEREVQSPGEYAETWIRDGGTRPGPDFDRLYNAWLNDFETRGVRRVGFGYLLLRLPTDAEPRGMPDETLSVASATEPTLRRLERLPDALGHNPAGLGAHLAECLAAHDWQAQTDDARLLQTNLTVASDVTEERHYWPGQQDPTLMTLHQGSGFGRSVSLDTALAGLVGACDGDLAVGAIIGALAQLLDADEALLSGELLPRVRELLADGFLTVSPPSTTGSGAGR
ncbi:hypothetical protein RCH23_000987 [Cryobacterium sp. CAN_C3]|uniref:DUF7059 domain-containing protein n=1 Tax=unclassified Cryobacterium TaxID=2649013 RepID=UPI0018CAC43D|nr:hypothetical protein [Cryobacterium sp. CAN_C3]